MRRLVIMPRAEQHLSQIEDFIAQSSYQERAAKYLARINSALRTICGAPFQGTTRDDLGPGMRTTGFEKRITIYYWVGSEEVRVVAVMYAGKQPALELLSTTEF